MPTVLGIAALGVFAVWGVLRLFAGHPPLPAPPRALTRREWAFVASAADTLYPPGGEVPPSGTEAGVPAYVDRYVAAVSPRSRLLMRLLFFLVEHATAVLPAPPPWGRRRFSSLSAEQRVAVLEAWRSSSWAPRRLVFNSLRAILTMGYFADPAVLRRLGLAPYAIDSPVCEADLLYPRVGAHPDTIPYSDRDLSPPVPLPPLDLDGPVDTRYAERTP